MEYVDCMIAAVPTANKAAYLAHARQAIKAFREHGALRVVECWGDDVPEGDITSMPMAVKCQENETVVFSYIVWPSREVRNQGMQAIMDDERMSPETNPMPFDGARLIYGGFEVILDE